MPAKVLDARDGAGKKLIFGAPLSRLAMASVLVGVKGLPIMRGTRCAPPPPGVKMGETLDRPIVRLPSTTVRKSEAMETSAPAASAVPFIVGTNSTPRAFIFRTVA